MSEKEWTNGTIKSKQNKFLDILKGIKKSNEPAYISCVIEDTFGIQVDKIGTYRIDSIYLPVFGDKPFIKTSSDVIVYTTGEKTINILHNKRFLSCKLKDTIKNFFVIKTPRIYVLIQYEEQFVVYYFDESIMNLEENSKHECLINDIILSADGLSMICSITENRELKIYSMPTGRFVFDNVIASFKNQSLLKSCNTLFNVNNKIYLNQNGIMRNIRYKEDIITADEIFQVSDINILLQRFPNKTILTLTRNNINEVCYEYDCDFRIKVIDNIIVLYDMSQVLFYEVIFNKLKLLSEIKHTTHDYHIQGIDVLNSKNSVMIVFIVKGDNLSKTLKPTMDSAYNPHVITEKLFKHSSHNPVSKIYVGERSSISETALHNPSMDDFLINLNIPTPTKREYNMNGHRSNNDMDEDLKNKNSKGSREFGNANTINNLLSDMNTKLERIATNLEDERKKNNEDNKGRFKKVLDSVSKHLNENLVTTIETAIKNEIRVFNQHSKKIISDCFTNVEKKNESAIKKLCNKIETCKINETKNKLSQNMNEFKEIILSCVVPSIKTCFETLKRQMIDEIQLSNNFNLKDNKKQLKQDKIQSLIQTGQITEAAMTALDSDENFIIFMENIGDRRLDDFSYELLHDLLSKATQIYINNDTGSNLITLFISSVLMSLETSEMTRSQLQKNYDLLKKLQENERKEDTGLHYILEMQIMLSLKLLKIID